MPARGRRAEPPSSPAERLAALHGLHAGYDGPVPAELLAPARGARLAPLSWHLSKARQDRQAAWREVRRRGHIALARRRAARAGTDTAAAWRAARDHLRPAVARWQACRADWHLFRADAGAAGP